MNKLWKKSWREHTRVEQETLRMNGHSRGASIVDAAKAVHPSLEASETDFTTQDHPSTRKRGCSDASYSEPESKRNKTGDQSEDSTTFPELQAGQITKLHYLPERVMIYENESRDPESTLLQKIHGRITPDDSLWPYIQSSQDALVELGQCASDLVWRRAIAEIGEEISGTHLSPSRETVRQIIRNWTYVLPNLDAQSRGYNISRKLCALIFALQSFASHGYNFKGAIFVKNQSIITILSDLVHMLRPQLQFLHPIEMFDSQSINAERFANGINNVAIVNSLDVIFGPLDLSCIIFFDTVDPVSLELLKQHLCKSHTYLIHLIEQGDQKHRNRLIGSVEPNTDTASIAQRTFLEDPTTRLRIYPEDAPGVILKVLHLKCPSYKQDIFSMSRSASGDICTVLLPGVFPVEGLPSCSPEDARRSACFRACQMLSSLGLLEYNHYPSAPPPDLLGNIHIETRQPGAKVYVRKYPLFWDSANGPVTRLYPLVLTPLGDEEHFSSLVLLTRQPLPSLPNFELFRYLKPFAVFTTRAAPFDVNSETMDKIYRYTVRLIRTLANKPLDSCIEDMHWFLLPLTRAWTKSPQQADSENPFFLPSIEKYIPWNAVASASDNFVVSLKATSCEEAEHEIENAVIQDRWVEFTKRFVAIRVRPDLSPLSKPPAGTREADSTSFLEFCRNRIKDFQGLRDDNQALIEVVPLQTMTNNLRPTALMPSDAVSGPQTRYLIPELCAKCTLSASVLLTAALIPSIMRKIDDLLIAKELNAQLFDCAISEDLLHQALCTTSANLEYNYERLELLGDSYLKYLSSVYLYLQGPTFSEGALHANRQPMINNKSLFKQAWERKIPLYIQSIPFSTKQWQPPTFQWSEGTKNTTKEKEAAEVFSPSAPIEPEEEDGEIQEEGQQQAAESSRNKKRRKKANKSEKSHELGDKALADVVEAIIGAAYLTGGDEIGLKAAKGLGVKLDGINQWSDFAAQASARWDEDYPPISAENPHGILRAIGYPVDSSLLSAALNPRSKAFERLEFIGDAIIDLATIKYLYHKDPEMTPGGLTLLKGAMVSNTALAAASVCSELYVHLVHDPQVLKTAMRDYLPKLEEARVKEYHDAAAEGRQPGQYWTGLECPKIFSDSLEAIFGAIFISDECSFVGVQSLFDRILKPFFEKHISLQSLTHHPTKNLFESLQAKGCQRFRMQRERIHGITRCSVFVHDTLLSKAEDHVATVAARRASLIALKALEADPEILPTSCDCKAKAPPTKKEREAARYIWTLEEEKTSDISGNLGSEKQAGARTNDGDVEDGMILE